MLYFVRRLNFLDTAKLTRVIGIIEILFGGLTLLVTLSSLLFSFNTKPFNVVLFVLVTAILSTLLGIGVLTYQRIAYTLLLYFSSVIVLTKLLMIFGIIYLNHAFQTFVPAFLVNAISILYHSFLIAFLKQEEIRRLFHVSPYIQIQSFHIRN